MVTRGVALLRLSLGNRVLRDCEVDRVSRVIEC